VVDLDRINGGLHPFPTRRSSDLRLARKSMYAGWSFGQGICSKVVPPAARNISWPCPRISSRVSRQSATKAGQITSSRFRPAAGRSEEHTSELQSREKLVCRLLLD